MKIGVDKQSTKGYNAKCRRNVNTISCMKGGVKLVNTQLLDEAIKQSGKSKSHLASKCNMSIQSFRLKRLNIYPFTTDDVEVLCNELNIKTLVQKDKIFFAKK